VKFFKTITDPSELAVLQHVTGMVDCGDIPGTPDQEFADLGVRLRGPVSELQPDIIVRFTMMRYPKGVPARPMYMAAYTYELRAPTWYVRWQQNGADDVIPIRPSRYIDVAGDKEDYEKAMTLLKVELL